MAAQVYTILERIVRKNPEKPDEKPVEGLNRQKTKKPTAYAIEYVLSAILVIRIIKKKCGEWVVSKELNNNQKRILKLAGFDEGIYCKTVEVIKIDFYQTQHGIRIKKTAEKRDSPAKKNAPTGI